MHRRKVLRRLAMLGGGAALGAAVLAGAADPASAQTFTTQRVRVVNAGFAYANTGHNVAVPTTNTNNNGTAIVRTGSAFAGGNFSYTSVNGFVWPH
jgi:hypothetical protein